jgi:putative endonuclease
MAVNHRVRGSSPCWGANKFKARKNWPFFIIMSYWVYILRSQSTGRYYCGHTNNLERRIQEHNDPDYKCSRTTKVFQGPWNLVWKELLSDRGKAMMLEKAIKKRGIGRYLSKSRLEESRRGRD